MRNAGSAMMSMKQATSRGAEAMLAQSPVSRLCKSKSLFDVRLQHSLPLQVVSTLEK
jgi:hypothetical protein